VEYLDQNEGINQIGLAELLDVEPITLSRILDRLEASGLIERHPDPSDRRVRILRLAPAGRRKLAQAGTLSEVVRSEALIGVSEPDRLRLLETLEVVKSNLANACECSIEKAEASRSWLCRRSKSKTARREERLQKKETQNE
jgi:DNA-binding MarR family transcriptional regulator